MELCPHFLLDDKVYFKQIDVLSDIKSVEEFNRIHFYFYDKTIISSKFWKEPPETLNFYFKERIHQIASFGKKIRLMLSGGYDSYTVLLAFLKEEILIDEIVWLSCDITTKDYYAEYEYYNLFLPIVTKYKTELSKTKIKIYNTPNQFNNDQKINLSLTSDNLCIVSATPLICQYFHEKEFFTNHVTIWCSPKATIEQRDNSYYFSAASIDVYQGELLGHQEYFFIGENSINLLLKQLHMLKNYFEENQICRDTSTPDDLVEVQNINYFNEVQAMHLGNIYFTKDPKKLFFPFLRGKNYLRILAVQKHDHTKYVYDVWKEYYTESIKKYKSFLNNNKTDLTSIKSNYYSLSENKIFTPKELFDLSPNSLDFSYLLKSFKKLNLRRPEL